MTGRTREGQGNGMGGEKGRDKGRDKGDGRGDGRGSSGRKALVVGAGFAGCVVARELADAGWQVRLLEQRAHIGGNAYDHIDAHGVRVHAYGPHIFHTNSERVFQWLSRFTAWRDYAHCVRAEVDGQQLPFPINRSTLNRLYGLNLSEPEAAAYLARVRLPRAAVQTSEDLVLSSVGADLCDKFYRGYTRKQWGLELAELSPGVAARVPVRSNDDERYFTDTYQCMPLNGYTAMFEQMLAHPGIELALGTPFVRREQAGAWDLTVYTGPVDAYFDHALGRLPYRSLVFEHEHLSGVQQHQAVGTVNYPNAHAYTRITEFKHLTGQVVAGTSIVKEYPCAQGEPYYPVPRPENEALYQAYAALAAAEKNVHFVGRLAQYRYYNMDQVVAAALKLAADVLRRPLAA